MQMKQGAQKILDQLFGSIAGRHPTAFWVAASKAFLGSVVEYVPDASSRLHYGTSSIRLIVDSTIFPYTFAKGQWQFSDTLSLLSHFKPDTEYAFVDIGANVGLFTRQMLIAGGNRIAASICVEPEPRNHGLLIHNLSPFSDHITILNVAISGTDGIAELRLDRDNAGHHSLVMTASHASATARSVTVRTMSGGDLAEIVLAHSGGDRRLAVKCDTEGYDEYVLSALTDAFWDKVDVCLVEVSPSEKPQVEWERFATVLAGFPLRYWADASGREAPVDEILALARGRTGSGRDLVLARTPAVGGPDP